MIALRATGGNCTARRVIPSVQPWRNPATSFYKSTKPTSRSLKGSCVDAVATHYPGVGAAMGHHRGFYTLRPSMMQQTTRHNGTTARKSFRPAPPPKARRLTRTYDSKRTGNHMERLGFAIPNPAAAIPASFDVAQFWRHSGSPTPLSARPHKSATPSSRASAQAEPPQCTSPA